MNAFTHMLGRAPFVIGGASDPYLRRWWIIPRNARLNIYLHQFLRSDDDRALHDHPWSWNASVLLKGRYIEHTQNGAYMRTAPCIVVRHGAAPHRVELIDGAPVWTLFLTGKKVREWGFYCAQGWRHWTIFTASDGKTVGRGCE